MVSTKKYEKDFLPAFSFLHTSFCYMGVLNFYENWAKLCDEPAILHLFQIFLTNVYVPL